MTALAPVPGRNPSRRPFLAAVLLGCSLNAGAAPGVAQDLVPVTMNVGFSAPGFLQTSRNDIEATFKVLAETIGRRRGFQVKVTTRFFADSTTFFDAIEAGEINFAVLDSLAYVADRRQGKMSAVFMAARAGTPGRRYLLLVRRDSGLHSLADLRGKTIVELQTTNLSVGHTWLSSLLLAQGVGAPEEYFGSMEYVVKPSAAVLPVFFGRRDACLADDLSFKLMTEMNPQVGAQLQSVEISVPLVGAILCASESNWSSAEFRPVLLKALEELHLDPAGQQVLTLFRIDQLVPFRPADLDTARELWAAYTKLRQEARP